MAYFIIKGGVMMIPILLASVFGLAIILERWIVIRRVYRLNMATFSAKVLALVQKGKYQEALEVCGENKNYPLPAMYAAAIENRLLSRPELEKMLERMGNHYVKIMEKRLGGLVSVVAIAPLLGFLGTIVGLIRAFMAWEKAGNDVTVSALAGGIYEAMITTAAGLIVAIPYYLFYNFFISRIKYFAHELDDYASQLMELLTRGRIL